MSIKGKAVRTGKQNRTMEERERIADLFYREVVQDGRTYSAFEAVNKFNAGVAHRYFREFYEEMKSYRKREKTVVVVTFEKTVLK